MKSCLYFLLYFPSNEKVVITNKITTIISKTTKIMTTKTLPFMLKTIDIALFIRFM